jgi:hypothetical protein
VNCARIFVGGKFNVKKKKKNTLLITYYTKQRYLYEKKNKNEMSFENDEKMFQCSVAAKNPSLEIDSVHGDLGKTDGLRR